MEQAIIEIVNLRIEIRKSQKRKETINNLKSGPLKTLMSEGVHLKLKILEFRLKVLYAAYHLQKGGLKDARRN